MFNSIGDFKEHWHVVALANELSPGTSLKRKLYGHPLLIWRDTDGDLHALDDCCAHQHTPICIADASGRRVVCPYHGWQFDPNGTLTHVPSDPSFAGRSKCVIPSYPICELDGFIWLLPSPQNFSTPNNPKPTINHVPNYLNKFRDWPAVFVTQPFITTDELLIDNFMDPTHTAIVHDGLIRSSNEITDHEMKVTTDPQGVHVDFAERLETVGLGGRLLFGKSMRVKHTDEFLLPNLVRVIYQINGQPRFLSLIACTPTGPIDSGPTQAFIQLRYQFGMPRILVAPILKRLANKIIRQDEEITAAQFANRRYFANQPQTKVAADAVATRVQELRRRILAGEPIDKSATQTVNLRF